MLERMAARSRMDDIPRTIEDSRHRLKSLFQIGEMIEYDRSTATCTVEIPALQSAEPSTVGELQPAVPMRDVIYTAQHFSETAVSETLPSVRTAERSGETVLVLMPGGMSGPKYAIAGIIPQSTTVRNLRNVVNAVASVDYGTAVSLSTTAIIASTDADGIVEVVYSPEDVSGDSQVSTAEGRVSVILQNRDGVLMRRLRVGGDGAVTVLASISVDDDRVSVEGDLRVADDLTVTRDLSVGRDLTVTRNLTMSRLATGGSTRDLRVTGAGVIV